MFVFIAIIAFCLWFYHSTKNDWKHCAAVNIFRRIKREKNTHSAKNDTLFSFVKDKLVFIFHSDKTSDSPVFVQEKIKIKTLQVLTI